MSLDGDLHPQSNSPNPPLPKVVQNVGTHQKVHFSLIKFLVWFSQVER